MSQPLEEIKDKLKFFDDEKFSFDPIEHKYIYAGEAYPSITTFIKKFCVPFDAMKMSGFVSRKTGVPAETIREQWEDKNQVARDVGHITHDWIENYFNGVYQKIPTHLGAIDRINKFNVIYAKRLHALTPLAFERRMFSTKYKLAGTLDSLFMKEGKLFMIDWKTNSEMKNDDHPKGKYNKMYPPFEDMWDNDYNHYSIQVWTYVLMLEDIGVHVDDCFLVYIGENTDAQILKTVNLKDRIRKYLDENCLSVS
jgi:hypothetical protein